MKLLVVSPEIAPFAKTGGLADVAGALPLYLHRCGIEVSAVMPKYRHVKVSGEKLGEIEIQIGNRMIFGHVEKTYFPDTQIPLFLICNDFFYDREALYTENGQDYPDNLERFAFFCKAVLRMIKREWITPDLIHANDWQTALIPIFIKTIYRRFEQIQDIKTLFTIHNLAFHGAFPSSKLPMTNIGYEHFHMEELEFYNKINLMKGGIVFADYVNTVSETYAREIQTETYGCGLDGVLQKHSHKIIGILNGVDYSEWNPETDTFIPERYSVDTFPSGKAANKKALLEAFGLTPPEGRQPVFGIISRLTEQKGLDLVASVLPSLVRNGAKLAILGTGDPEIEANLTELHNQFPDSFGLKIAYDNRIAHWIEAGSDIFLMPSRFEPCGLNQMYSLRYGSIPVVRTTGGLADTIIDDTEEAEGNGFRFDEATPGALMEACERAIDAFQNPIKWDALVCRAMQADFSWEHSAKKYIHLYGRILTSTPEETF